MEKFEGTLLFLFTILPFLATLLAARLTLWLESQGRGLRGALLLGLFCTLGIPATGLGFVEIASLIHGNTAIYIFLTGITIAVLGFLGGLGLIAGKTWRWVKNGTDENSAGGNWHPAQLFFKVFVLAVLLMNAWENIDTIWTYRDISWYYIAPTGAITICLLNLAAIFMVMMGWSLKIKHSPDYLEN